MEPPAHTPWGYHGPNESYPRKYIKGALSDAYIRNVEAKSYLEEYREACKRVGATPNSGVEEYLSGARIPRSPKDLLGGDRISLRDTYLGERGFLALMPLIDRNTCWTCLDASNNGLRNEAVLHLVDMLLQPQHMGRSINLNLSRNPISQGAAVALLELVRRHPHVEDVNFRMTKVPWRIGMQLHEALTSQSQARDDAEKEAVDRAERAEKVIGAAAIEEGEARAAEEEAARQARVDQVVEPEQRSETKSSQKPAVDDQQIAEPAETVAPAEGGELDSVEKPVEQPEENPVEKQTEKEES